MRLSRDPLAPPVGLGALRTLARLCCLPRAVGFHRDANPVRGKLRHRRAVAAIENAPSRPRRNSVQCAPLRKVQDLVVVQHGGQRQQLALALMPALKLALRRLAFRRLAALRVLAAPALRRLAVLFLFEEKSYPSVHPCVGCDRGTKTGSLGRIAPRNEPAHQINDWPALCSRSHPPSGACALPRAFFRPWWKRGPIDLLPCDIQAAGRGIKRPLLEKR